MAHSADPMSGGERDRLAAERDVADRRYGVELTKVDRALPSLPESVPGVSLALEAPSAGSRGDTIIDGPPDGGGWRGWLARAIWRVVGPFFERQQTVNARVANDLADLADATRRLAAALPEAGAVDRRTLQTFLTFHSALVQCLQQVPSFVDTKIRLLEASLDDVRMTAAAAQRAALAVRTLEQSATSAAITTTLAPDVEPPRTAEGTIGGRVAALGASYVGFEDLFRGSEREIAARQMDYAKRLAGASNVLDLGCGRGEFLALLRDQGVQSIGVDANREMVEACAARGLTAVHGDGLDYLAAVPDESLGGITAFQVVEHLEPDRLVQLLRTAFHKLRPGGTLILETINVACWVAFFEAYIRDITHTRPLHPDTLKYLVVASGFTNVDIHFRSPVAEDARLQAVEIPALPPHLAELATILNRNVERLNTKLFTSLDYAVIGTKAG